MAQTRGGALERAAAVPAETRERIEELKSNVGVSQADATAGGAVLNGFPRCCNSLIP